MVFITIVPWSLTPFILNPNAKGVAWWFVPFFLQCMLFVWLADVDPKEVKK